MPGIIGVEGFVAVTVNHLALLVHHVVVLQRVLAAHVVALLDALLRVFHAAVEKRMLEFLTIFQPETFHDAGHAVGCAEVAHQIVFEAHVEAGGTRVALAGATAAQLTIDPARFVAFGAKNIQAAEFCHPFAQLDVRPTARHIGGDRDRVLLPCTGDDLGLLAVVLGIENTVRNLLALEHAAQQLG